MEGLPLGRIGTRGVTDLDPHGGVSKADPG